MKPQGQPVGGKWLNEITVLIWMLSIGFTYFLLSQSMALKDVSQTKEHSFYKCMLNIFCSEI